jgi:hypothetical protein
MATSAGLIDDPEGTAYNCVTIIISWCSVALTGVRMSEAGLTIAEILMVVNRYIGVSGGYLGDFNCRTHADFYPEFCSLEIDPNQYGGTTRERFIAILKGSPPEIQAKILRGVIDRFPVSATAPSSRTQSLQKEIHEIIRRLEVRSSSRPIDSDFPASARNALAYVLTDLNEKGFLVGEHDVILELNRLGRIPMGDLPEADGRIFNNALASRISRLAWDQVYRFCERVYSKLLKGTWDGYEEIMSIESVRYYFANEVNLILEEENLAFHFVDGGFQRRGRAQTQKSLERVGAVLSDPRLEVVRSHFNKARRFFDSRPLPDSENCVKEALCAMEASIEVLTSRSAAKDFEKSIKQLLGNAPNQIPPPIGESIIKLHAYRGSGQGVSHAATQGNRVSPIDAELVLSLVAAYITYFVVVFPTNEEVPF